MPARPTRGAASREYGAGRGRDLHGSRGGMRLQSREPEPEPEPAPDFSNELEEWTLSEYSSGDDERAAVARGGARAELRSLSVEELKARAREMQYVNEDTLRAVDDMESPKRYLISLLSVDLDEVADEHLLGTHEDPELSEAHLSDSPPDWHRPRTGVTQRDVFQDPDLSEAELTDASPYWHRPQAVSRHEPVVAASWRPEPAHSRVVLAKARRKFDEAMVQLCSPVPFESEHAMTSLETALRLLGSPWDHVSQELCDLIEAKLKAVPRRYLSDELAARSTRQREWEREWETAVGSALVKAAGHSRPPRARSPQGSRAGGAAAGSAGAAAVRSPRRAAHSPRRHSPTQRHMQQAAAVAYERAEVEKNDGLKLQRRRDFQGAAEHYDRALRILEQVHAHDKRCADMTALLQRKRQACTDTLLQQAGSSRIVPPSQMSPTRERHAHSQRQLNDLLESAEDMTTRTRGLLARWQRHMAKVGVYDAANAGLRTAPQRPKAVDSADRNYKAAVDAFNRGDGQAALELVGAGLDLMPRVSRGSPDKTIHRLRTSMEKFQLEASELLQEQHQLLSSVRAAFRDCQEMQEQLSSKAWDATAAASRPGNGRANVSPGRGGEVKWNNPSNGPISEQEVRLKVSRQKVDSMLRLLRSAQQKRRRGAKGARASPDRGGADVNAGGAGGAKGPSPQRPFRNVLEWQYDSSSSPTGDGFRVPPHFQERKQIMDDALATRDAAIVARKNHDYASAAHLLDQAQKLLGQPWGADSKRLREDLARRQAELRRRSLHYRAGTSRSTRVADSSRSRSPSPGVQQTPKQKRPRPVELAGQKYRAALDEFDRGNTEDALDLVEQGMELLPAGSSDAQIQQLQRTMEEFQRDKEALLHQSQRREQDRRPLQGTGSSAGGSSSSASGNHDSASVTVSGGVLSTEDAAVRRTAMKPADSGERTQSHDKAEFAARTERIRRRKEHLRRRRRENVGSTDSD